MTNEEAYNQLNANNVHWNRKDKNHILVWVSGYMHMDCYEIEKFLLQAGMRLMKQEFDPICGKTVNVFKHK